MEQLLQQVEAYKKEIAEFSADKNPAETFRIKYLGTKGLVKSVMAEMKNVPNEKKREFGQILNEFKIFAENRYEELKQSTDNSQPATDNSIDLTLPGDALPLGSRHPISLVKNKIISIFQRLGFAVAEGPEIEDDWHNFTALNMPEDHPARDMQDTFFISQGPDVVMRTHTSSVQVMVMQSQAPPIRTISPGRVFRKDSDATHSPVFHQVEGLFVDEGVSFADLKQTLFYFVQEMFGEGTKTRFRPSYFPFTEPSAEMDILGLRFNHETGKEEETWIEVLGCGMVDPAVLENCGIDSEKYTGFAFGIGIERMSMVKYNIQDIRLFYENDLRFLGQFRVEHLFVQANLLISYNAGQC